MEAVLSPAQMRAADQATILRGVPGPVLMDRAAHACAVVALRLLGGAYGKRVVVVCGKGNNGGDGIACARHLSNAGVYVTTFLLAEPTGDAAEHFERPHPPRARFASWSRPDFDRAARMADLVIDAVLGTGFQGPPRDAPADAIAAINASRTRVLSVDIASGVSGADGTVPGDGVQADVTVAIQALKIGHVALPGAQRAGRVDVADIGIPVGFPDTLATTFVPSARDVAGVLPSLEADTHKYRVGALAILAGSAGMTGAAVLTAKGAIRAGAGMVIMGVPSSTLDVFEHAVAEAIKVPLPESEGQLEAKAVDEFEDRLRRCRALAIGPGLGRGSRAVALMRRALDVELPLVIDGDGLWALAEIMKDEPGVLRARSQPAVLTPHVGEYTFLAGRPPLDDRVSDVRDAALKWGAVVHLKGRRALSASPQGQVWINTSGNPGAATAGSGDVLTGITGSVLAQGMSASSAMWSAAYLHGLAADFAAAGKGERALAAGDLPEALPAVLRHVERSTQAIGRLRTVLESMT